MLLIEGETISHFEFVFHQLLLFQKMDTFLANFEGQKYISFSGTSAPAMVAPFFDTAVATISKPGPPKNLGPVAGLEPVQSGIVAEQGARLKSMLNL